MTRLLSIAVACRCCVWVFASNMGEIDAEFAAHDFVAVEVSHC